MMSQLIEQQEVKRLINSGELVHAVIVMNPTSRVDPEDYALRISCGDGLVRYLKRQDIARIRVFRSLDAAWATAQRLGLTSLLLQPFANPQSANLDLQVA